MSEATSTPGRHPGSPSAPVQGSEALLLESVERMERDGVAPAEAGHPYPGPRAIPFRLAIETRSIRELGRLERESLVSFAGQACSWVRQELYLHRRFLSYDRILMARDARGLLAFQLLQEFGHEGDHWVYFGPLFSRQGAYLPMFAEFFRRLLAGHPGQALHLFAEIENPRVFLAFKLLFPEASYPRLSHPGIPRRIQKIAQVFADRLEHIKDLDLSNLKTRSGQTLFRAQSKDRPVIEWMSQNGVELARGDSQGFLVSCGPGLAERARILSRLSEGLQTVQGLDRRRAARLAAGPREASCV